MSVASGSPHIHLPLPTMHNNPPHDAATSKPTEGARVRVWLANGGSMNAIWEGGHWRTINGYVEALQWKELPGGRGNAEAAP